MKKVVVKPKKKKRVLKAKQSWSLLKSNAAKLFFVLTIALAIPLTVIAVQQVQNTQQEAASTPKAGIDCSAQANSPIIADPVAPELGQTISFKRASGSFSSSDFDYNVVFGNGIDSNKCDFSGGEIKNCPTKKSTTKDISIPDGNGGRTNTKGTVHTITDNGKSICEYYVVLKESKPAPTKDPTKPTKDPKKPTTTPDPKKSCEGNLSANACTSNNKPRLRASWNMKDDQPCSIKINGIQISTECSLGNMDITQLGGKDLESNQTYSLQINGVNCNKTVATAKSAACGSGNNKPTPKPTEGNGGGNPGGPTPTPGFGTPDDVDANCNDGTQDTPKITVTWKAVTNAKSYTVKLLTAQNGSVFKEQTSTNTSSTFDGIQKDQTYWYTVSAKDASGKSSSPSNSTRNIKCTDANLKRTDVIGAIANTFQELMNSFH